MQTFGKFDIVMIVAAAAVVVVVLVVVFNNTLSKSDYSALTISNEWKRMKK
jgi:hypothetical protein